MDCIAPRHTQTASARRHPDRTTGEPGPSSRGRPCPGAPPRSFIWSPKRVAKRGREKGEKKRRRKGRRKGVGSRLTWPCQSTPDPFFCSFFASLLLRNLLDHPP